MKLSGLIVKLAVLLAAIGAAVYFVTAYWDTLVDVFYMVVGFLKDKKEEYTRGCCVTECEDFAD